MNDSELKAAVARIDERTKFMKEQMEHFVTKEEFSPVRKIVYGATGVALTAVLIAIMAIAIP